MNLCDNERGLEYNGPMDKLRCQSCGMPLGTPGFYGTMSDGAENLEYCKFCFQKGEFTQPHLTLEGMIESSIDHMTKALNFPHEEAERMSREMIPQLKRWK